MVYERTDRSSLQCWSIDFKLLSNRCCDYSITNGKHLGDAKAFEVFKSIEIVKCNAKHWDHEWYSLWYSIRFWYKQFECASIWCVNYLNSRWLSSNEIVWSVCRWKLDIAFDWFQSIVMKELQTNERTNDQTIEKQFPLGNKCLSHQNFAQIMNDTRCTCTLYKQTSVVKYLCLLDFEKGSYNHIGHHFS